MDDYGNETRLVGELDNEIRDAQKRLDALLAEKAAADSLADGTFYGPGCLSPTEAELAEVDRQIEREDSGLEPEVETVTGKVLTRYWWPKSFWDVIGGGSRYCALVEIDPPKEG